MAGPKQAFEDTRAPTSRPSETTPRLEVVVAVAANGVIGRANQLPWHLPGDLRRFRRITSGHAVVMGRKTWQSIGRPLPDRQNIVVTRQPAFRAEGAEAAPTLAAALALARLPEPAFCIGGAELFREAMPLAARLHVTEIDRLFEGDVILPAIDPNVWRESSREVHTSDGDPPFQYAFVTYDRASSDPP